jgi:uncharacterized protein YlzI (FlbEa/FlbD family)
MLYITLKNKKCFIIQKKIKNVVYNIKIEQQKIKCYLNFIKFLNLTK